MTALMPQRRVEAIARASSDIAMRRRRQIWASDRQTYGQQRRSKPLSTSSLTRGLTRRCGQMAGKIRSTLVVGCQPAWNAHNDSFRRFDIISECHRQTDRHWQNCAYYFKGLQSFGRQDVWATDVWATNFFSNVHLGDTKLDAWATMTSRLGDKSKSLHLGQPPHH